MIESRIKRLLLIEDNPGDARLIRELFNEQGARGTVMTHVETMRDAEEHLAEHETDIILLDLGLPDATGLEAVRRARVAAPRIPLVVLTGRDDETLALESLQEGAQDYLVKGQIETRGLLRGLRYAIERKHMEDALFVEKERAEVTLNSIGAAVVSTDNAGNITFLSESHFIDNHELHITTSIGVSVFPDDGLDAETLIKNADTAMYQAKENGRQSCQFFRSEMNVRAVERQAIEEGLRRALERNEFVLHYQPKIDLNTGAITGVEALIRWTHPTRGSISPAQFIPIAEECGLILPIGHWVLRTACEQARAWAARGLPEVTIAVNVSATELHQENFLEALFAILAETGMDARSLEVELTEGVLMAHAEAAASILQTLREKGVHIAIDDFGTGCSSEDCWKRWLRKIWSAGSRFSKWSSNDATRTSRRWNWNLRGATRRSSISSAAAGSIVRPSECSRRCAVSR